MLPKSSWITRCLALVLLIVAGGAACGSSNDPSPLTVVEAFASRLQEKGFASRTFVVSTAGTVQIQLVSTTNYTGTLGLGLGTVSGIDCALSTSLSATANATANSPQISTSLGTGTYCVKVYDDGTLNTITDFGVTITKPY